MTDVSPVALITGAARRLGAATAELLHQHGFRIIIHYRNSAADANALANKLNTIRADSVRCLQADLADMAQVKQLGQEAVDSWGRLDALINNASTFFPTPVGTITEHQWQDLFTSNAQAPLFLAQEVAPALAKQHGCIVNIADIWASTPLKDYTTYCMAKAANTMLTKSLARELAPAVRVNSIAPGCIIWPDEHNEISAAASSQILADIPLRRQGEPLDIARTALFLISEAPYITGQIIAVDGGRSLT